MATQSQNEMEVLDEAFERARRQLEERYKADLESVNTAQSTAAEDESQYSPTVVFDSVSRVDFRCWLERREGALCRWHYEPLTSTTGRVEVYSLTTHVRASPARRIIGQILEQIADIGRDVGLWRTLDLQASPTCDVGDRDQEPSQSLRPFGKATLMPNLVVEVAYQHESWELLVAKLNRWMGPNTTVQVVIGIEVFSVRQHAILLQRGYTPQEVEFGPDQSEPAALTFPMRVLYHGAALPPALAEAGDLEIRIDLVDLRYVIGSVLSTPRS